MPAPSDARDDLPLVTALVPVHDHRQDFLEAALGSLFEQTEPAWAAVVIVEADRRASFERELETQLRDPRIRLVVNEGQRLAGALNTGMRAATSPFVAILLGDDLWSPDAVEVLSHHIRSREDVDFFHSARRIIDDHGQPTSKVYPARHDVSLADFERSAPVKHLLCWRRAMGLEIGGMDESLQSVGPDDLDFPWSMAERGATFGAIDDCLYVYRDHRGHRRLTTHLPRSAHLRAHRKMCRKHGVPRSVIRSRLRTARRTFLRQCIYRSWPHYWISVLFRRDLSGRRQRYR